MIELILGSTIVALVGTNVYLFTKMMEMNEKYMKAFMARNLTDYTSSEIIKEKELLPIKEEPVPLEQADDSVFTKFLKQVNHGQEQPEV